MWCDTMRFDIVTLFPEMFAGYLGQSLLNLAIERQLVDVRLHNLRDWARGRHREVDDRPFGGGPGMVIKPEPVVECIEELQTTTSNSSDPPGHLVMLTPQGRRFSQRVVEELADHERLILLCGRYEGFDERVNDLLKPDEISIGDFVLNGGEVAAMVVVDATIRLVPGVLGDAASSRDDSFSTGNRLLEYAQYTRPRIFRGLSVPDVLLSGNHPEIAAWREQNKRDRTAQRRSDLLDEQT
jgi:tRNA (guanine37-N1)-methyltransferase